MPVYTAWLMRIAESSCKTQATPRLVGELKASGKRSRIWYWHIGAGKSRRRLQWWATASKRSVRCRTLNYCLIPSASKSPSCPPWYVSATGGTLNGYGIHTDSATLMRLQRPNSVCCTVLLEGATHVFEQLIVVPRFCVVAGNGTTVDCSHHQLKLRVPSQDNADRGPDT